METIFSRDNSSAKKYVAFFDLDRTIISTNSGKIFILQGYKHGLLTRMDIIKGIYLSLLYWLDLKDASKIIDSMVSWVKGVTEKKMIELSEEIFKGYILQSIHNEALTEIESHKRDGGSIVMLSSAILPIGQRVADHLKMDDVLCSNLESFDGIYTGRPVGRLCFGDEKVNRLMDYCTKNNVNPGDSWYYGDSIADFPALSFVGFPVCVNPDKKLRRIAKKRNWRILKWDKG